MQLEDTIEIQAPIENVWQATINVDEWPKWLPTMERVTRLDSGLFQLGSAAKIKQPKLPETIWKVSAIEPGKNFTWETTVRGMQMVATHELSKIENGSQCTLRIQLYGLWARLMWPLIRKPIANSLRTENECLKSFCEGNLLPE